MAPTSRVYRIDGSDATPLRRTHMVDHGLLEVDHLEAWVVTHPEIIGENVRVVTRQYDRWSTSAGQQATERLDILGLDSTGQLIVVELKRDGDKRIHLQALTYAALVAGFTKETLGEVHAAYANKSSTAEISAEQALALLAGHVEEEWRDDLLTRPRVVLIAERFPLQMMTTVSWLTSLAPRDLDLRCIEITIFDDTDSSSPLAAFQQIFPVEDITDRILSPTAASSVASGGSVSTEIAERTRRQRSVPIIVDNHLIADGARVELVLETLLRPETVTAVRNWLDVDGRRSDVRWINDRRKPLQWAYEPTVVAWSATGLAQHIVSLATGGTARVNFSGPDAWTYNDLNLYTIASECLGQTDASSV